MIPKLAFALLLTTALIPPLHAQQRGNTALVNIRAVLHDPINPTASLFYTDKTGALVPLQFRPHDLSEAFLTLPVNGSLVLHDKAEIDRLNPDASMAASATIPPGTTRAMVVVLPAHEGEKPPYRMLVIDDSENAFPKGESRVLALIDVELAVQAGEHKLSVHPGKVTRVPPVRKVSEYNMAQTNFYYRQGDAWMSFTERQLQYLDACRRLFIVHATPGAMTPTVTTIVDTAPGRALR